MEASRTVEPRDMSAEELLQLALPIANDKQAEAVTVLRTRELSSIADYFVIASSRSERQGKAIAETIQRALRSEGRRPLHVEGMESAKWILLDYGDVVIHVFHHDTREVYRLEKLWAEAPILPLSDFGVETSAGQ